MTTFSNFFSQKQIELKKRRVIENCVTFVTFLLGLDFLEAGSTLMPPWERVELRWPGCSEVHSN